MDDFDADGKADLSVVRPTDATWYIQPSSGSGLRAQQWGLATDKLVPADYDGDGKADMAVFRNGNWHILRSMYFSFTTQEFGASGNVAVPSVYVPQ